jgi:hypothetical protein
MTNPKGHLFPDFGIDETRSRSWKTRLLDPAAFIATVYNPDNPDIELPSASEISCYKSIKLDLRDFNIDNMIPSKIDFLN